MAGDNALQSVTHIIVVRCSYKILSQKKEGGFTIQFVRKGNWVFFNCFSTNSTFVIAEIFVNGLTRPGRLVKFTTRLVSPHIVATLTLVTTNFEFPRCIKGYCLSQAQCSKVHAGRIVPLMFDCV